MGGGATPQPLNPPQPFHQYRLISCVRLQLPVPSWVALRLLLSALLEIKFPLNWRRVEGGYRSRLRARLGSEDEEMPLLICLFLDAYLSRQRSLFFLFFFLVYRKKVTTGVQVGWNVFQDNTTHWLHGAPYISPKHIFFIAPCWKVLETRDLRRCIRADQTLRPLTQDKQEMK